MNQFNRVVFSSNSDEWETPQNLFDKYNAIYNFDLDVCASFTNHKVATYFDKETNGLNQSWHGNCWMNPPYSRGEIGKWMKKAYEESLKGVTTVCLVASRTDVQWWHNYAIYGDITFIKGRLKFGGAKYNAPFPSAIVIFKGLLNE